MIEKVIRLRVDGGIWVADHYEGEKPDPYIVDLFGTHTVPLPYTAIVDSAFVLSHQSALAAVRTPHVRVELVTA